MAKGTKAKENVIEIIKKAFGDNYIGEVNKKYYVWADDDDKMVQIAISLTCPTTEVEASKPQMVANTVDDIVEIAPTQSTEISEKERETLDELMQKLGLSD